VDLRAQAQAQAQPSTPTWGSALLAPLRFPLPVEDLILVHVEQGQGLWRLHVRAASATTHGPTCQTSCSRVHSASWRTLDDAPCAGQRAALAAGGRLVVASAFADVEDSKETLDVVNHWVRRANMPAVGLDDDQADLTGHQLHALGQQGAE
jgi:hypothetical protein